MGKSETVSAEQAISSNQTASIDQPTINCQQHPPQLSALPWQLPLNQWPETMTAELPKGLSRHTVRFVRLDQEIISIKETSEQMALREYELLKNLQSSGAPTVDPLCVITQRRDRGGNPLPGALVTRYLSYSLPYSALYSKKLQPDTVIRLVDALSILLVRLHLIGFCWGDLSLSNTLFRRDAGAFAAYLVDAETGSLYADGLSEGRRRHDLEVGKTNIAGEIMNMARKNQTMDIDAAELSKRVEHSYLKLWEELTKADITDDIYRRQWMVNSRIRRLNLLGFDIAQMSITTDENGRHLSIQPKVVDAGHHGRRLMRLTGIDAEENQARSLLNELDLYITRKYGSFDEDHDEMAAHQWLEQIFNPVLATIPIEFKERISPAEVFHRITEHRLKLSTQKGYDVSLAEVVDSYLKELLKTDLSNTLTGAITITRPLQTAVSNWQDYV